MCHAGYHPSGCREILHFLHSMYHSTMMAINYQSAQEANAWSKEQRDVIQNIKMIQDIHIVLENYQRRMIHDIIQS